VDFRVCILFRPTDSPANEVEKLALPGWRQRMISADPVKSSCGQDDDGENRRNCSETDFQKL
jgi:hypothetical protein